MIKNIYTNAELTHPPTTVTMPDGSVTSGAGPDQVYAAGWREVIPFIVPDGLQVIEGTRTVAFDESHDQWTEGYDTETPEEAAIRLAGIQDAQDAAELERQSIPLIFDTPLEAQSFVFVSHSTGIGYEYFVDDGGDLLKIVAHSSPLKSAEEREALKVLAAADHAQRRSDRTAEAQDIKSKVRGSGGWKSLQAEVERLATLVEAMQ